MASSRSLRKFVCAHPGREEGRSSSSCLCGVLERKFGHSEQLALISVEMNGTPKKKAWRLSFLTCSTPHLHSWRLRSRFRSVPIAQLVRAFGAPVRVRLGTICERPTPPVWTQSESVDGMPHRAFWFWVACTSKTGSASTRSNHSEPGGFSMLKICGTCAVAKVCARDENSPATHECRANPPTIDQRTGEAEWPRVISADWCGEWRNGR